MARWQPDRSQVIDDYAREVLAVFPRGRVLVGIDGLDGAGKTTFSRDLAAVIRAEGVDAAAISMDSFHTERAVRHQPPDDERTWYEHAYDHEALRTRAVQPYRRGEPVALEHRSREDDSVLTDPPTWTPPARAVLVVEGIFLLRPELRGLWHTTALLRVDEGVAFQRCVDRDGWDPAPDGVLNRVFFGAERRYVREVDPQRVAAATFDLTDPEHPHRVFADAC